MNIQIEKTLSCRQRLFLYQNLRGGTGMTQKIRINWLTVTRNIAILAVLGANILATIQLKNLGGW